MNSFINYETIGACKLSFRKFLTTTIENVSLTNTDKCFDPTNLSDPCCNKDKIQEVCCTNRNVTISQPTVASIFQTELGERCKNKQKIIPLLTKVFSTSFEEKPM